MKFDKASDYLVISSGQRKLEQLQANNYLHNIKGNYEEIGGSFSPIDISIMDKIMEQVLSQQKMRESMIYQILGISGIDEFNNAYYLSGGNNKFIDTSITEVLERAAIRSFSGDMETRMTKKNKANFISSVSKTLEEMIDESYGIDDTIGKELKNGLGPFVAQRIAKKNSEKVKIEKLDKYIERISDSIRSNWRGELGELETKIAGNLLLEVLGKVGKVTISAKDKNAYGKFIKADNLMDLGTFTVGIQNKNYEVDDNGDVEFSLHSSGKLENFYKLINESKIYGADIGDIIGIQNVINSFQTPYFKYHLINQAAFAATKKSKRVEETNAGHNLISFIKKCLPLFIGAQVKIKGDQYNVDFFNVSGHFIPVSTVMEEVFNNGAGAGLRIGLYSNYNVPWVQMREQKMEFPVENEGDYYSDGAQRIGGYYGSQLYNDINMGTVHLRLALSQLV